MRRAHSPILALLLAFPTVAAAQQPSPEPGAAPPPAAGEEPPPEQPPPGYYAPPPNYYAPQPAPAPARPAGPEPTIRIRAGANGALALFFPGPSYGANFNGRIGIQIKKLLGVYGDFGAGFGFGGSIMAGAGGGGVSINLVSYWRLGAMAEFDLGPFFVAAGPYLFNGEWAGISQIVDTSGGASQAVYAAGGYFPALLGRIGFSFGQRNRFTIAFETMAVFGKMTSISQNANMNGAQQTVRVGNPTIGLAPALMFGWDMR